MDSLELDTVLCIADRSYNPYIVVLRHNTYGKRCTDLIFWSQILHTCIHCQSDVMQYPEEIKAQNIFTKLAKILGPILSVIKVNSLFHSWSVVRRKKKEDIVCNGCRWLHLHVETLGGCRKCVGGKGWDFLGNFPLLLSRTLGICVNVNLHRIWHKHKTVNST